MKSIIIWFLFWTIVGTLIKFKGVKNRKKNLFEEFTKIKSGSGIKDENLTSIVVVLMYIVETIHVMLLCLLLSNPPLMVAILLFLIKDWINIIKVLKAKKVCDFRKYNPFTWFAWFTIRVGCDILVLLELMDKL